MMTEMAGGGFEDNNDNVEVAGEVEGEGEDKGEDGDETSIGYFEETSSNNSPD